MGKLFSHFNPDAVVPLVDTARYNQVYDAIYEELARAYNGPAARSGLEIAKDR